MAVWVPFRFFDKISNTRKSRWEIYEHLRKNIESAWFHLLKKWKEYKVLTMHLWFGWKQKCDYAGWKGSWSGNIIQWHESRDCISNGSGIDYQWRSWILLLWWEIFIYTQWYWEAFLSVMIECLKDNDQLFFTTHNTDYFRFTIYQNISFDLFEERYLWRAGANKMY